MTGRISVIIWLCCLIIILGLWAKRAAPIFGVTEDRAVAMLIATCVMLPAAVSVVLRYAIPIWRHIKAPRATDLDHLSTGSRLFRLGAGILATATLGIVFIGFYGMREAEFVPTAAQQALAHTLFWPTVIGATLTLAFVVAVRKVRPGDAGPKHPVLRVMAILALGSFVFFFTARPFWSHGLPALHSLVAEGAAAEISVTVVEPHPRFIMRLGCNGRVKVRGRGEYSGDPVTICELDRDLWETLRPGQTLSLSGRRTDYGFRYESVTR